MSLRDVLDQARRERERRERGDTAKKIAVGTIIGSIIGVASGLLFAPKAGKETREDIAEFARDTTDEVKLRAEEAYDTLREKEARLRDDIKGKYEDFVDRNMTELEPVKEDLQNIKGDVSSLLKNTKEAAKTQFVKTKSDAEELKDDAADVANKVKSEAAKVGDEVADAAKDVGDQVRDSAKEVKDKAEQKIDEHKE